MTSEGERSALPAKRRREWTQQTPPAAAGAQRTDARTVNQGVGHLRPKARRSENENRMLAVERLIVVWDAGCEVIGQVTRTGAGGQCCLRTSLRARTLSLAQRR